LVPGRRGEPARIAELDGIRGIAILLVFFYHSIRTLPYSRWHEEVINRMASTGWVGVDLFFVLSGFLITGILLDAKGSQRYFIRFYARRVLRILPLYLTFIIFALHVAPVLRLVGLQEAARFPAIEPWYWAHSVNFLIASSGWGSAAAHTTHLWSLSVEEQFYLLWPALVFLLGGRDLRRVLLVMIAAAPLLRGGLTAAHVSATTVYVLLPTRMDSLAAGALLAVMARVPAAWQRCRQLALPLAAVGAALVAGVAYREGAFGAEARLSQLFGYSPIVMLASSALIVAVSAPDGSLARLICSHPLLRFFGKYSYGIYVWHVVVIESLRSSLFSDARFPVLAGSHLPGDVIFAAGTLLLTTIVALASWHVVENPFLRLKRFLPYDGDRRRTGPAVADRVIPISPSTIPAVE
jgi:peptidoglycan/LPS O-acetylase OafA/YrhL